MAEKAANIAKDGPDLDHLHDDLEGIRRHADDVASASGELREHRKHLIDLRGYNKKALGFLYQIWKLPDEKLQDFLRTFEPAFRELVESRRQHGTPDMIDENEKDYAEPADPEEFGDEPTQNDFGDEAGDADFGDDDDFEDEMTALKRRASELGVVAPHNIGLETLRQKVAEAEAP